MPTNQFCFGRGAFSFLLDHGMVEVCFVQRCQFAMVLPKQEEQWMCMNTSVLLTNIKGMF